MDEFKKPFEYFEEKGAGGFLLVLFFMMISFEPILGIMAAYLWADEVKYSDALTVIVLIASAIFILSSVIVGLSLKKLKKFSLPMTKILLVYRVLFLAPVIYFSMKYQLDTIPYRKDYVEYQVKYNEIMTSFEVSMAYVIAFSVGWTVYLNRSEKVRQYFPKEQSSSAKVV